MLIDNLAIFCLIITSSLLRQVENKSIFGIGTRIIGDQLLVKDVLRAPPAGWSYIPTIRFNYAIPEPITYVEIISEENVIAEVNFSYKNDLVVGTITAINSTEVITTTPPVESVTGTADKFHVLITIYGFNDTILNLNSAYVLNRDQDFQGVLEPQESDEEYYNLSNEELDQQFTEMHAVTEEFDGGNSNGADDGNDDENDDRDDIDFEPTDKLIELGHRQKGDYQIYETFQTSLMSTQDLTSHSVVFYYVDSNYITYAKFVVYDHSGDKTSEQNAPIAEYSHFSPTTLKAIITDHKTNSLFVQMFLYGYKPKDLPTDYEPYLVSSQRGAAGSIAPPMSALQRLKLLMNSQRHDGTQTTSASIKKQDDEDTNEDATYEGNDGIADGENDTKEMHNNMHNNMHSNMHSLCSSAISIPFEGDTSVWCSLVASLYFLIYYQIQCLA